MTREEFTALGAYAKSLWPEFVLTPEQADVWWERMQFYTPEVGRKALREAYAKATWKYPMLAEVLEAARKLKDPAPVRTSEETPEKVAAIQSLIDADRAAKLKNARANGVVVPELEPMNLSTSESLKAVKVKL